MHTAVPCGACDGLQCHPPLLRVAVQLIGQRSRELALARRKRAEAVDQLDPAVAVALRANIWAGARVARSEERSGVLVAAIFRGYFVWSLCFVPLFCPFVFVLCGLRGLVVQTFQTGGCAGDKGR